MLSIPLILPAPARLPRFCPGPSPIRSVEKFTKVTLIPSNPFIPLQIRPVPEGEGFGEEPTLSGATEGSVVEWCPQGEWG